MHRVRHCVCVQHAYTRSYQSVCKHEVMCVCVCVSRLTHKAHLSVCRYEVRSLISPGTCSGLKLGSELIFLSNDLNRSTLMLLACSTRQYALMSRSLRQYSRRACVRSRDRDTHTHTRTHTRSQTGRTHKQYCAWYRMCAYCGIAVCACAHRPQGPPHTYTQPYTNTHTDTLVAN